MKQTAIDWLIEQLKENNMLTFDEWRELFKQAKEMEKRQIEEALLTGLVHWNVDKPISEYYNETFNK